MKRILPLILSALLLASIPFPIRARGQVAGSQQAAQPNSPEAKGWIALVAGDVIDLKWDPAQYPTNAGETWLRWEIWRGRTLASMQRVAEGGSMTTDFYRDEGLTPDAYYYYEISAVFCKAPCLSPDDESSYRMYRSSSPTQTGRLHGTVHHNLVLSAGTF